ncbi:MAG: hypothetical protein MMC23_004684 [Stictis urceolatum]|nr:hypothetical protein [Stictis urceolata]
MRKRWAFSERKLRQALSKRRTLGQLAERSIIGGIASLVGDAAKLLSCAEDLVNNLVTEVEKPDPEISIIENLADTLNEVGKDMQEGDQDPTKSQPASTQGTTTSSGSCTASSAVPQCTETVTLSTSIFSGQSVSSSVQTITATVCTTVTACDVHATTAITTVSIATATGGYVCDVGSCGAACTAAAKVRRYEPVDIVERSVIGKRSLEHRELEDPDEMWSGEDYDKGMEEILKEATVTNLKWEYVGIQTVSIVGNFEDTPNKWRVPGLTGYTSIAIISQQGMWLSHILEPPFRDNPTDLKTWQSGVIDALKNGHDKLTSPISLAADGKVLAKAKNPQIYMKAPLMPGSTTDLQHQSKVDELLTLLTGDGVAFNGIEPTMYKYRRRTPEQVGTAPLLGRVIVEHDNNEVADPTNPPTNQQSIYRIWLEREPHAVAWDSTDEQKGSSCPAGNQKRDGSCTSPSGTATAGPTTAGPTSTGAVISAAPATSNGPALSTLVTTSAISRAPPETSTQAPPTSTPATTSTGPGTAAASEPAPTSTAPASGTSAPTCAPTTGNKVPQSEAQTHLDDFCSNLQALAGSGSGSSDDTDSIPLASVGTISSNVLMSVMNKYYTSTRSVVFNVTLTSGESYRVHKDECEGMFGSVLSGCAPTGAASEETLFKYGGSLAVADGAGNGVLYSIDVEAAVAIS